MAENGKKAKQTKNFHIRFRPDQAEWLQQRVKPKHENVPQLVRKIIDKEIFRQELRDEQRRKSES